MESKVEEWDDSVFLGDISIQTNKLKLDWIKDRSAPGADDIKYTIIKKCPEIVFENLQTIYIFSGLKMDNLQPNGNKLEWNLLPKFKLNNYL